MRRTVLPIAAILLTAACSSGTADSTSKPASTPAQQAAQSSDPAPAPSQSAAKTAKPKPSKSKGCGPARDVIVRYKVPGIPDTAQALGGYNLVTCESTFDDLQKTSPTGAGYCTEAAWASDNPGYDADADSPKPLKNVKVSVGAGC